MRLFREFSYLCNLNSRVCSKTGETDGRLRHQHHRGALLSYLLTPYYTRVFGQEAYGVVTYVYALIPLVLTLLTMGMESSYFRFSAKADEAGGDVPAAKRRLFATTWASRRSRRSSSSCSRCSSAIRSRV